MAKTKSSSSKSSSSKKATIGKKLKKASSNSKRLHVIPRTKSGDWAVKSEGSSRASSVSSSKSEAVATARQMAKSGRYNNVMVHAMDGTIVQNIFIKDDIATTANNIDLIVESEKSKKTSEKA